MSVTILLDALANYRSLIILLAALYIIPRGIFIRGAFAETPLVNTIISLADPPLFLG